MKQKLFLLTYFVPFLLFAKPIDHLLDDGFPQSQKVDESNFKGSYFTHPRSERLKFLQEWMLLEGKVVQLRGQFQSTPECFLERKLVDEIFERISLQRSQYSALCLDESEIHETCRSPAQRQVQMKQSLQDFIQSSETCLSVTRLVLASERPALVELGGGTAKWSFDDVEGESDAFPFLGSYGAKNLLFFDNFPMAFEWKYHASLQRSQVRQRNSNIALSTVLNDFRWTLSSDLDQAFSSNERTNLNTRAVFGGQVDWKPRQSALSNWSLSYSYWQELAPSPYAASINDVGLKYALGGESVPNFSSSHLWLGFNALKSKNTSVYVGRQKITAGVEWSELLRAGGQTRVRVGFSESRSPFQSVLHPELQLELKSQRVSFLSWGQTSREVSAFGGVLVGWLAEPSEYTSIAEKMSIEPYLEWNWTQFTQKISAQFERRKHWAASLRRRDALLGAGMESSFHFAEQFRLILKLHFLQAWVSESDDFSSELWTFPSEGHKLVKGELSLAYEF